MHLKQKTQGTAQKKFKWKHLKIEDVITNGTIYLVETLLRQDILIKCK